MRSVGPLPVEVHLDVEESRLVLRNGQAWAYVEVTERDPLQLLVDLGLLLVASSPAPPRTSAPPRAAAAPKPADQADPLMCARPGCGKPVVQVDRSTGRGGRPKRYCEPACAKLAAREARKGPAEDQPLPSSLPPIEESGAGMRSRIAAAKAAAANGPKPRTLLDALREKQAATARRNGVDA